MPEIILASTSPYRRMLVERFGITFRCESPGVDEDPWKDRGLTPEQLVDQLSEAKAATIAARFPDAVVIGSDQVVALDSEILGKPGTRASAAAQLRHLSGTTHRLVTGIVVLTSRGVIARHIDTTTLRMRELSDQEIDRYLNIDESWDCAGSYKLESLGISLFTSVESQDPTAMIGLPMIALAMALRTAGMAVP
jgi:septum formation protein